MITKETREASCPALRQQERRGEALHWRFHLVKILTHWREENLIETALSSLKELPTDVCPGSAHTETAVGRPDWQRSWQQHIHMVLSLQDRRCKIKGSGSPAAWFHRTPKAGQCVAGLESYKEALGWLQVPGQTGLHCEFQMILSEAISENPKE